MTPGLYTDITEAQYHADAFGPGLRLSVTIAKDFILESASHAHLHHPQLGGQSPDPTKEMDRGTLCHKLLLGKGVDVAVIECDAWTKKKDKAARDAHRDAGRLPVTRKLHDETTVAAEILGRKLAARGFGLTGQSEVTLLWDELASNGNVVHCRARLDHLLATGRIYELKIGDANPKRFKKGHLSSMGYDIQRAAYVSGLSKVAPELLGRIEFWNLFCEPFAPYCVTPVRHSGSLRELGEMRWRRAIDAWERCLRLDSWPDYVSGEYIAEARGYELEDDASTEVAA